MMFSETTVEGIYYIAISGGSFCILPGLYRLVTMSYYMLVLYMLVMFYIIQFIPI